MSATASSADCGTKFFNDLESGQIFRIGEQRYCTFKWYGKSEALEIPSYKRVPIHPYAKVALIDAAVEPWDEYRVQLRDEEDIAVAESECLEIRDYVWARDEEEAYDQAKKIWPFARWDIKVTLGV